MKLLLQARDQIELLSNALAEELDSMIRRIKASWNVEHKDDDTHGDVTADSVAIRGGLRVEGLIDGALANTLVFPFSIYAISGASMRSPDDDIYFQLFALGTGKEAQLQIGNALGGAVTLITNGTGGLVSSNDMMAFSGYRERSRLVPMGEWIQVAYNAANFVGGGALTWTVQVADQAVLKYTLIGKTMTVSFAIINSSTGGVADADLRITIPDGYLAANFEVGGVVRTSDAGAEDIGWAYVSGGAWIGIRKRGSANWSAAAVNNTLVEGMCTFEIQ